MDDDPFFTVENGVLFYTQHDRGTEPIYSVEDLREMRESEEMGPYSHIVIESDCRLEGDEWLVVLNNVSFEADEEDRTALIEIDSRMSFDGLLAALRVYTKATEFTIKAASLFNISPNNERGHRAFVEILRLPRVVKFIWEYGETPQFVGDAFIRVREDEAVRLTSFVMRCSDEERPFMNEELRPSMLSVFGRIRADQIRVEQFDFEDPENDFDDYHNNGLVDDVLNIINTESLESFEWEDGFVHCAVFTGDAIQTFIRRAMRLEHLDIPVSSNEIAAPLQAAHAHPTLSSLSLHLRQEDPEAPEERYNSFITALMRTRPTLKDIDVFGFGIAFPTDDTLAYIMNYNDLIIRPIIGDFPLSSEAARRVERQRALPPEQRRETLNALNNRIATRLGYHDGIATTSDGKPLPVNDRPLQNIIDYMYGRIPRVNLINVDVRVRNNPIRSDDWPL